MQVGHQRPLTSLFFFLPALKKKSNIGLAIMGTSCSDFEFYYVLNCSDMNA